MTDSAFSSFRPRAPGAAGRAGAGEAVRADVAIVGFGYAGLATLLHLVRVAERCSVAVVARDASGLGLAYSTREPGHLLNVAAERMGAVAGQPEHFAGWLRTPAAASAAAALAVPLPGALDYAPRALYGSYLRSLLELAVRLARERQIRISWLRADAEAIEPGGRGGWVIATAPRAVEANACVLAIGNEPRRVFGAFTHRDLHPGPWTPHGELPADRTDPVVLIGSGLSAVDSIISLRSAGYDGTILVLSRTGRFPAAHRADVSPVALDSAEVERIRTLADVLAYFRAQDRAGRDWRAAIDGLRPHTQQLWQRLSPADQREAINRWSSTWNLGRHRMAAEVAERIDAERRSGALSVLAIQRVQPRVTVSGLALDVEMRADARRTTVRPAAVVDSAGLQLDCAESGRALLRNLIRGGICAPHPTGLGLAAADLAVADNLYTLGSLLTGQLWETIAVPELRDQAARIARRLTHSPRRTSPTRRSVTEGAAASTRHEGGTRSLSPSS